MSFVSEFEYDENENDFISYTYLKSYTMQHKLVFVSFVFDQFILTFSCDTNMPNIEINFTYDLTMSFLKNYSTH